MTENNELPKDTTTIVSRRRQWIPTLLISLGLFGITLAVYWPACDNDFVAWDDNEYVYEQPQVLKGIRWEGLVWATQAKVAANWHPLTMISLQLDAHLFGTSAYGFHRTSIVIHSMNAILLFLAMHLLTGDLWKSAIVAAVFSLHPMRVESVAWISERKDVLSGSFFFLTLMTYGWYVKAPSIVRYLPILFFFGMGLCSKPMLVTTPCVLLLLDFWPLARIPRLDMAGLLVLRRSVFDKLPLFGMSLVASIVTLNFQQSVIRTLARLPLGIRFENAMVSLVVYIAQSFVPIGLSPYYARHTISILSFLGALILLLLLTCAAFWLRKRFPYVLVGWLWYLGMLVPVIGLIQVGHHARADRYLYLSQIGLIFAVVWWVAEIVHRLSRVRVVRGSPDPVRAIATCLLGLILVGMGYLTTRQISVWHNSKSMWHCAYQLDSNNSLAMYYLAEFLLEDGNSNEATALIHQAIRNEDRSDCETLVMLGMLLADCGDYEGCVTALDRALNDHPNDSDLLSNRAKAYCAQGKWSAAINDYRRATQSSPNVAAYKFYLAHALAKVGQDQESRAVLAAALRRSPQWPQSAAGRAWQMTTSPSIRFRVNFWPVCLAEQACLATGGNRPEYLDVVAAAYADSGRFEDAVKTARRAFELAQQSQNSALAAAIGKRLDFYQIRQPYREPLAATNQPR